jgi:uncharacterized membrane protein
MTSRVRLFGWPLLGFALTLVGAGVVLASLHPTLYSCSVGFRNTGQPLSSSAEAQCVQAAVAAALLLVTSTIIGGVAIWYAWRALAPGGRESTGDDLNQESPGGSPRVRLISRLRGWPAYRWVCLFVALYFAVTFFSAGWQYLHLATYDEDLAINQQVLSSTVLGGRPYQFYEAFNCGNHGQCSYLLVHQAFFGYAVALGYAIAPTPYTLFAIQSLAYGLAALPLCALAMDLTRSRSLAIAAAGAYLAWVPLFILAVKDTFNWEAFIPVELLTIFWLWNRQKYLVAAPVVLLAFLTYEVNSVLVFFIGVYFVWPWMVRGSRLFIDAIRRKAASPAHDPTRFRLWAKWVRTAVHVPEVYASISLMAISLLAYALLRLFVLDGGWIFGLPPVPMASSLPISSPNEAFDFSFSALLYDWSGKLVFWIVIYLTLAFVPLFAPRTLLLALPWIVFTLFNITPSFWTFAGHYVVPVAPAVMIGFVFGLMTLQNRMAPGRRASSGKGVVVEQSPGVPTPIDHTSRSRSPRRWTVKGVRGSGPLRATRILALGVVVIVAGNLLLNPLDPIAASLTSVIGPPFPSPYGVSYATPTSDLALEQMVSLIPRDAVIAATVPVYTLVANDPYTYLLKGNPYNLDFLPGNESNRVEFVLLPDNSPNNVFATSPQLLRTLYDKANFGVRACVSSSPLGAVELFQRDYSAAPAIFGESGPLCPNYFAANSGLNPGPFAISTVNVSSPSGTMIQSTPCSPNGVVWTGPNLTLPAGPYGFRVVFAAYNDTRATCHKAQLSPSRAFAVINVTLPAEDGQGSTEVLHHSLTVGACLSASRTASKESSDCNHWYSWNSTFVLSSAESGLSVSGTLTIGQFILQVAYVVILPGQ